MLHHKPGKQSQGLQPGILRNAHALCLHAGTVAERKEGTALVPPFSSSREVAFLRQPCSVRAAVGRGGGGVGLGFQVLQVIFRVIRRVQEAWGVGK